MNEVLASPLAARHLLRSTSKHAQRPALGIRTGISPTLDYPGFMENQVLAVAADGSVWTMTGSSLCRYDVGTAVMTSLYPVRLHKPHAFGFQPHLGAVSSRQAFFLHSRNNQPVISEYRKSRNPEVVDLPALPESNVPTSLSAAADGSLWVLDRQGRAWRYQGGETPWLRVGDETHKLISAGSRDFVLALGEQNGWPQLRRLSEGKWVVHDQQVHAGVRWIGACEGGEYWWASADLQRPGELHLIKDDQVLQSFKLTQGATGFAAATRRSCYFYSLTGGFARAAIGVIDQPAQEWPTLSTGEKRAYDELSAKLGITLTEGVRKQYKNVSATFSTWYSKLQVMAAPEGVAEADWATVKAQIMYELECVQAVISLGANIALLNKSIEAIQTNTYNHVVHMLGLPDKKADMPSSPVELVLNMLVDKLEGAVIDKAKSMVGSEVIDIGMACYRYGNDLLAQKHDLPDGSIPLIIACADLADTLADSVVESEKARAKFLGDILGDWGRLSACGEAINSGLWYWGTGTIADQISGAGDAIKLSFYQILMPAKWKIVLCQGIHALNPPLVPYMPHVPRYALMYQRISNGMDGAIYWWTTCMEVSAAETQRSEGPFPNQKILEAVFKLETTPLDFFTGRNGWKLRRVSVPGYLPPTTDLPWVPYENSTAPIK